MKEKLFVREEIIIKVRIKNAIVIYDKKFKDELSIVSKYYFKICNIIEQLWEVEKPRNIKIYIMASDLKYILYSYPMFLKILTILLLPFWYLKVKKEWSKHPGASDLQSDPPSILLKPINVCESLSSNKRRLIFKESENIKESYHIMFCQLLTFVYMYKIKLPMWLLYGITAITEETFMQKKYIKEETINMFDITNIMKDYKKIDNNYHHAKGYWTVRYLEENYPGFLKESFKKYRGEEIVEQIILKLGLDSDNYWEQLDELLYENYKHLLEK